MFRKPMFLAGACLVGTALFGCCTPLSAQTFQGRYDLRTVAPGYYVVPNWDGSNPYWTGSYTGEFVSNYGPYDPFSRFHSPGIYGNGLRVIENSNSRFRPAPRFRQP